MLKTYLTKAAMLFTIFAAGCVGSVGPLGESDESGGSAGSAGSGSGLGPGNGGGTTGGGPVDSDVGVLPEAPPGFSLTPLRRMTSFEYNNVVRDLLGTEQRPADSFSTQRGDGTFDNDVNNLAVSATLLDQYLNAADSLAAELTSDANISRVLQCDLATADDTCIRTSLEALARRAYRRPVEAVELDELMTTYAEGRSAGDTRTGLDYALSRIFISPYFLYWVETGAPDAEPDEDGRIRLTPWEVATRLSRLLWGSMPDDELFSAAESGALETREHLLTQARRVMRDSSGEPNEQARTQVTHFHDQWLGLGDLEDVEKGGVEGWNAELAASMRAETEQFLGELFWKGGAVQEVFAARYSFVDARLAPLYGVNVTADTLTRVDLDGEERAGLLTQPSIMALTSLDRPKPMARARYILHRVLCAPTPPPPPSAPTRVPEGTEGATERERFENLTGNEPCTSCHEKLNGIGFSFDMFDALGRVTDVDAEGLPLDTSGALSGTDVDGPIDSAIELAEQLAESDQVRGCMLRHWFRFANGRFETAEDIGTLEALKDRFAAGGYRLEDLVLTLVESDDFLHKPAPDADAP